MVQPKEKYRHELKFYIPTGLARVVRSKLDAIAKLDKNVGERGMYMIRSLYFDDYWNSAYEDKINGVALRKKYRVRIYNYSDALIKLERKKKYDRYIYKEDATITKEQFYQILDGRVDFMLKSGSGLLKEFYYETVSRLLKPKIIVDYERVPYADPMGDVRITLDLNVRAALSEFDIFRTDIPLLPVLQTGTQILEVKFTEFLPSVYRTVLNDLPSECVAASKYLMCRESKDIDLNFLFNKFMGV